jgi:hypothetical protein
MKTIKNIENQIIKLKANLTFAEKFLIVCESLKNKEKFSFQNASGDKTYLFTEKTIFNFGGLSIKEYQISHFIDMYKICFMKKIDNKEWLNVISCMKYVLKNYNVYDNKYLAHDIADEFFV